MNEQRNLILALAISGFVLLGWNYFSGDKDVIPNEEHNTISQEGDPGKFVEHAAPTQSREDVLNSEKRIVIDSPKVQGSINLKGARLNNLTLKDYHQSVDPQSPNVVLFSPEGTEKPYYVFFQYQTDATPTEVPDDGTVWKLAKNSSKKLSPNQPLILYWENGAGVRFEQHFTIDDHYLISVNQKIVNTSSNVIRVAPKGVIRRGGEPETQGFYILHEGPIGYINKKLQELSYEDVRKSRTLTYPSQGGWSGITDKYWFTAFVPTQGEHVKHAFEHSLKNGHSAYQTTVTYPLVEIPSGHTQSMETHLYAGAKILNLLDMYEAKLGVTHFDLAVDFGWFYFLTKPLFYILELLYKWVGNFGLAIILLTVLMKALFYPLASKSHRSMAKMKELQPKLEQIKEAYKEDKLRMNQEVMALYKKEKINPMAGCLPMVLQIPVFFALYKVLFVTIEMRHAPFFGWIHDLSAPDPTSLLNLFGMLPWSAPGFLQVGVWPILMGLTMFVQQKLNPTPTDPAQQKMMLFMPLIFTFMLAQFPAGLVIYWAVSNILTIIQQVFIMKGKR